MFLVKTLRKCEIPNQYKFINGNHYYAHQLIIDDEINWRFTEILLEGRVSLYHYDKNKELKYFVKVNDGEVIGLKCESYEIKRPYDASSSSWYKEAYLVEFAEYKEILEYLFQDNKLTVDQMPGIAYEEKSLKNITKRSTEVKIRNIDYNEVERKIRKALQESLAEELLIGPDVIEVV